MPPKRERQAGTQLPDVSASDAHTDLTWLAHRAATALSDAFNKVSQEAGLSDLRDWLVLALISSGPERTQLEIATELGIDKTTLVAILDRLERDGLIVRRISTRDRRARIPKVTVKGLAVKEQVAIARETAVSRRLAAIPFSERAKFHAMLWSIVQDS